MCAIVSLRVMSCYWAYPDSDWTIPHLPVLRNLLINFEKGDGASVIVDLGRLPSILSFEISYYHNECPNLMILGHSRTLKQVTVMMPYIDLSFFQLLGETVEKVDISSTVMASPGRHPRVQLTTFHAL
jgi:hypothetical protein